MHTIKGCVIDRREAEEAKGPGKLKIREKTDNGMTTKTQKIHKTQDREQKIMYRQNDLIVFALSKQLQKILFYQMHFTNKTENQMFWKHI